MAVTEGSSRISTLLAQGHDGNTSVFRVEGLLVDLRSVLLRSDLRSELEYASADALACARATEASEAEQSTRSISSTPRYCMDSSWSSLASAISCENSGLAAIQVYTVFEQGRSGASSSIRARPVSEASRRAQISSTTEREYLVGRPGKARFWPFGINVSCLSVVRTGATHTAFCSRLLRVPST